MPSVPHIIRVRQQREKSARRRSGLPAGLAFSLLLSVVVAVAAILTAFIYADLSQGLPSVEILPALLDPPDGLLYQPTRLYDRTGEHVLLTLDNPDAAGWEYLQVAARAGSNERFLPRALVAATIATAHPTFWEDYGFSPSGILPGDHPTLAQQLVSDLLLADEPAGLRRALRERLLAAQITSQFGREQVLEWYLNSVYYGRLAYGADAAARVYFGKPAADLNLAESAMLAAVAQSPALNPLDAPQAALDLQRTVLQKMLDQELITPEAAEQALQTPLQFRSSPSEAVPSAAPAFTDLALEQLAGRINRSRLERGGLRVITTLDYALQQQAECTAAAQLARLSSPSSDVAPGTDCPTARRLPPLSAAALSAAAPPYSGLAANVVVLDPITSEVLALVGELSPGRDPARLPGHPPGTLFTPFIYLTGFTRGLSPASLVWDIPPSGSPASISLVDSDAGPAENGGVHHGPMRLRMALANDALIPASQVLEQVGAENVWRTARQLGLVNLEDYRPVSGQTATGLLWDAGRITLLETVQAFGVFANQGTLVGSAQPDSEAGPAGAARLMPLTVVRIEDTAGNLWWEPDAPQKRPVLTPQLAYLMTAVLSDEAARWPSLGHPNPLEVGRPAAAKLGSLPTGQDAWAVGYSQQRVVGVWIGAPGEGSRPPAAAAPSDPPLPPQVAAGLWNVLFQTANQGLPADGWALPPGVSSVVVCDPSGLLPTSDCPARVNEVFLSGSEPSQTDSLYRGVQINRENGRLATVFTPPDLIEERIFLIAPPEAQSWAETSGLPAPPQIYDIIAGVEPTSPNVRLTAPAMFAVVGGQVAIEGHAAGEEFTSYRIQVGPGLNPDTWLQVGEDFTEPVRDGQLALWDTSTLSGLYTVQLQVVGQGQQIQTHIVQVTVDNRPPEVRLIYPAAGQEVELPADGKLTLRTAVEDDLEVIAVTFYLDDRQLQTVGQPPFSLPWAVTPGEHTLRLEATDRAGNTAETETTFVVK